MLVAGGVAVAGLIIYRSRGGEGGAVLVVQVHGVVVVQGEALPEVRGQFAFLVKGGSPGQLPGGRMPVGGGVEQVHGLAGQEEAALPPLGHAPHHRFHPAVPVQPSQQGPCPVLGHVQHGGQVARAGQGHPRGDFKQALLLLVQ